MDRRLLIMPLLALAGTSLSGCVAVAIPALAGAGMIGTRIDGKDAGARTPAPSPPAAAVAAAAPRPAPSPNPSVTVMPSSAQAAPAGTAPARIAPVPAAPAPIAPRPAAAAPAAPPPAAPAPAPAAAVPVAAAPKPVGAPSAAPSRLVGPPDIPDPIVRIAPPPAPAPAPASVAPAPAAPMPAPSATVRVPAAPAPVAAAAAPMAVPAAAPSPLPVAPAAPSAPAADPRSFAQFVRYGRGVAAVSAQSSGPLSAMLADPIALDGQRKRCAPGEQPVAMIDLDPAGSLFAPPADPERDVGRALGLAVLREAGVQIAWLSDLPVAEIGAVRTALEQAGLDPRGQDIVSLRRDPEDRKQARKESLAATSCIIAIAGDAKADFDERFQYLKNPEAGAALETAIGDGWFLIEPIFPAAK